MKTYFTKSFSALLTFLCPIFLIHDISYPQNVTEEWTARYTGEGALGSDRAYDIAVDKSGNVYVTGSSETQGQLFDFVTVKYNPGGQELWAAKYNGPDDRSDISSAITVDDAGNVYVTGFSGIIEGVFEHHDFLTIKYNSGGIEQWVARYDGPADRGLDVAADIVVDADGNVYVTGRSAAINNDMDYATIKYNSEGLEQWVARYNGIEQGDDQAVALAVDNSGNIFVTGFSQQDTTSSTRDYVTIKYNSNGQEQWVAVYSTSGDDEPNDLAIDNSGNVYVTGKSNAVSTGEDYLTVKYTSEGVEQWTARYTGLNTLQSDRGKALAVDNAGNVYVTGGSYGGTAGGFSDYATVKYNSDGVEQWAARYSYPNAGIDEAVSIALDEEGNIYVGGFSQSETLNDYAAIKYNANGEEQWVARYNGSANSNDMIAAIAVDEQSNVYVTGTSRGAGTVEDYVTIKYSQKTSDVQTISSEIPDNFTLFQNYPNPFNPTTKIKFAVPFVEKHRDASLPLTLKIYNILGNEVATLVDEYKPAGTYEIEFNVSGLASGIYYYQLSAGSFSETKKMILLK